MLTKILAASVFTIGLATSAMAQSSDVLSNSPAPTNPAPTNEERMTADPSATGSINGDASGLNIQGNPGPVGPCASNSPGPDANARMNVNDQYCGK
ncbi:MAG: hypothetical protein EOR99_24875 [Mesorhizobium sp.]|uniref:hypothetical protein n=1 Tax=unclassified Mesorhizobium TaxID=325217 RepID=UPI000FD1AEF0|nr:MULTISPECIES: hypothetical protein [unclassified Mesorhizobium]RUU14778.1 hypothetical protein EOD08_29780 [Mesorhizobium sp. M6A.T.Ca.TU.002.02.2.1]RUV01490.1 hypothetical protein EOB36_13230 [Mesorhizobium sp. M6A.T.Cr.TU.017.01.1.1]RWN64600.1 MAG: hypothetical protein EOR99_24875 [Mesorhizobium sp.]RWP41921.1 MAG: hypothetical protein EOR05_30225 [Mesorhizobium sp.]